MVMLMSILVIRLNVLMMVWSFFEWFFKEGMRAAVSSAKVLVVGILVCSMRSRESDAKAKMSGERGPPCRLPRLADKLP